MVGHSHPSIDIVQSPWTLFGREREQRILQSSFDAATKGNSEFILISGEAGIGKTTLVNGLAVVATAAGAVVLSGGCYDLTTTPPYGPWREIADQYLAMGRDPELPASIRDGRTLDQLGSQAALFSDVLAFVAELSTQVPVVLILEDMHWSDAASADLLRFVARHRRRLRLLMAVTYRDDEIARSDPLYAILPLIVRESTPLRLELSGFSRDNILEVIRSRYLLSERDEGRLVTYLDRITRGNPFFVTELLHSLQRQGVLSAADDGWSLGNIPEANVPPLIQQFVDLRLGRLRSGDRNILETAAVLGNSVSTDVLAAVADTGEAEVLQAIDAALGAHILEEHPVTGLQFVHALVRSGLYTGIDQARRRSLHLTAAHTLARRMKPDTDAIAHHFYLAHDYQAIGWLLRAGEQAERSYAWMTAAERYLSAVSMLEQGVHDVERARQSGWLRYHAGRLMRFSDEERAIALLTEAENSGSSTGDALLAAYCLADRGILRCMNMDIGRGLQEARAGIARIEAATARSDESTLAAVARWVADSRYNGDGGNASTGADLRIVTRQGTLALWLAWTGYGHEAITEGETCARHAAHASTARDGYADAMHALALAYAAKGQVNRARDAIHHAQSAYREIGHHILLAVSYIDELLHVHLPYRATDVTERQTLLDGIEQANRRGTDVSTDDRGTRLLSIESYVSGNWQLARDARLEPRSARHMLNYWLNAPAIGWIARAQGDTSMAWRVVLDGLPGGPAQQPGDGIFLSDAYRQRLAIQLSLDASDLGLAETWLAAHDRWTAWAGDVRETNEGNLLRARVQLASGNTRNALQIVQETLVTARTPFQPLTLLAAHRLCGQIQTMIGRFDIARSQLSDALELANACDSPLKLALTRVAIARLETATGNYESARQQLDLAKTISQNLGATLVLECISRMTGMPAFKRSGSMYPSGLTAREVDVIRLVAEGLSDAEVAERLFIARRTVTSHLTSIYTKLGVSSRAAATRFAVEHGLTSPVD